ncbi:MAG: hypothetical protein ABI954_04485 [Pyrinomonadaceae bacterium]
MADKNKDGIIKDENENYRYDRGEAAKDAYEHADAYEKDKIELRGIAFFMFGLVFLIGVTFVLMALMQRALEYQAETGEKGQKSPMMMTREENLPPEPRLQAAPGYQVQREDNGKTINLELREPQSEYRELRQSWEEVWKNGRKDPQTGTVITLPMDEAKKKVLEGNMIQTRAADQANKAANDVRLMPSYMSAGRASEIRRQ